jgi:hypothetical protein
LNHDFLFTRDFAFNREFFANQRTCHGCLIVPFVRC